MNIIEYADSLDLIILTHAGMDIGLPEPVHCPPKRMRAILDQLQPKRMVLAHLGGWKQWDAVEEYLAGANVYLDTAFTFDYISEEAFYKIWKKHDKEKILFATDSPWSSAAHTISQVNALNLSLQEKENIFSNNAKKLLRFI
jgi:predicted TIM-barrel fold metal-dependent hydrolase